MRVTCAVREYVRKAVFAKVQERYDAAEKAADAAEGEYAAKVKEAHELAKKLAADAQAKFEKAVERLGLTWIRKTYDWTGRPSDDRAAIKAGVDDDDFAETAGPNSTEAKANPSAVRDRIAKLAAEPGRIKAAAKMAADKLLFELELGKVAKKELDEALKGLEVEL